MCGIAGAFIGKGRTRVPIREMAAGLKHRGPDDEGYVLIQTVTGNYEERAGEETHADLHLKRIDVPWPEGCDLVFGHRRLSIIDLTSAGHQPMSDSKKEVWINYNGEIYNYKELRQELENLGVRFFSSTDTEVVVEAYKMWGMDCLHKFNGMWAFALWDSRKKILFCSRDRFGVKPFYYAWVNGNFYFASEIKALLLVGEIPKKISEEAVFDFLALGLIDQNPQTFFSAIHSLEPGHFLTLDTQGWLAKKRWYFFPESLGQNRYHPDNPQEFLERLSDSVRLRLQSDVRVGTCLSGGLDSSSIVCLAVKHVSSPLETFSGCFEEEQYDERKFIQPVLDRTGARPHFVFPQGKGFWEEWPELVRAQEEPFGSTSLYAHWCVMREAFRHKVNVLLNGQGGDELLGGYPRYQTNRALGKILQGDIRGFSSLFKDLRVLGFFAFHLLPPFFHLPLADRIAASKPFLRRDFLNKHLNRHVECLRDRVSTQRNLNESLRSDFLKYILPNLLRYEDKNSMYFSVEVRLPFMDYRLVEWVFGLEDGAKIENGLDKRILREGMKGILPEEVRLRIDKMGWSTPQEMWLTEGASALRNFFNKPLQAAVAPWVRVEEVKKNFNLKKYSSDLLWRIINLEMWFRVFFMDQACPVDEPVLSLTGA